MKIKDMKENITTEELEAFKAGYSSASLKVLDMLREFLTKVNNRAPTLELQDYGLSIAEDFIDNIIRITDGVREVINEKIEELEPLRNLEKKEETIRH